jgi:hypothetical protein
MNCPSATGTVPSSQTIEPIVWAGPERAQFTIGVSGCGQRQTIVVICSDASTGCFAGDAGRR